MAHLVNLSYNVNSFDSSFFPTFFANKSFVEDVAAEDENQTMTWDSDWGWEDSSKEEKSLDTLDWNLQPMVSVSPLGDIVAVASDTKFACLQKVERDNKNSLELLPDGIMDVDVNEYGCITALLCLPLASHKKSLQGSAEWTCVVIGYDSGHVSFYTDKGEKILSQYFHNSSIVNFKYNSFKLSSHYNDRDQIEELSILYEDVLVIVDGFSLYQTLKVCRSQLARGPLQSGCEGNLQLSFKKWQLRDQKSLNDHVNVGLSRGNPFDQLVAGSMLGGPYANIKATPPVYTIYVVAGSSPFIAYFYASEEEWQPLLANASELAMAVASKVKSALYTAATSWFSGSSSTEEQQLQKQKKLLPSTPLSHRYGLPDKTRLAVTVSISPLGLHCATVDTFGRIILLDVATGVALRMWKGYRDAQVGWISVKGDNKSGLSSVCTFIVIYAPRRGLLELWVSCNGPRIAAFNVCKKGRLIYTAHSLMGLNATNCKYYSYLSSCFYLSSDGSVKVIEVPFHLAFTDSSSHQTHDFHLVKKFREIVKSSSEFDGIVVDRLTTCLSQFKLVAYLEQAVDRLLNCKLITPSALDACLRSVFDQLKSKSSSLASNNQSNELQKLELFVSSELDLLGVFTSLSVFVDCGLIESEDVLMSDVTNDWKVEVNVPEDILGDERSCSIRKMIDLLNIEQSVEIQQSFKIPFTVSEYLRMFFCLIEKQHNSSSDSSVSYAAKIQFGDSVTKSEKATLGEFLFQPYLNGEISMVDFQSLINWNLFSSQSMLMESLVHYWLNYWRYRVISGTNWIANFMSMWSTCLDRIEENKLSSFHSCLRSTLCESVECSGAVLLSLIVIKHIQDDEIEKDAWLLLISKLIDCAALNLILSRCSGDEISLCSVRKLEEGNRGLVSELVARAMVLGSVSADQLERLFLDEHLDMEFHHLQSCFPLSLQYDVLASNCAWEFVLLWSKDTEQVDRLESAMKMLSLLGSGAGCLKQGVSSMLWHVHLSKVLQQLVFLVDKSGRVPAERLIRRETGMTTNAAFRFTQLITDFLLECFDDSYSEVVPALGVECLWEEASARLSLCELALDQSSPLQHTVQVHWQLTVCVQLMLHYRQLNISKLLHMFDSRNLFKSLTSVISTEEVDKNVSSMRSSFLTDAIKCAVSADGSDCQMIYKLSDQWLGKDKDRLRRAHICQLFAMGKDRDAESMLTTVSHRHQLSIELLPVLGSRVARLPEISDNAPPSLKSWLNDCKETWSGGSGTVDDTKRLLTHILNDIQETQSEYRTALQLSHLLTD